MAIASRPAQRPALAPPLLERALAAWRESDVTWAIHPGDRDAVRETEAARALVLELFSSRDPRDLYNACARLGRLLGDRGASPSLVASTIDGATRALTHAGIAFEPGRVEVARASVAEGYHASVEEAERAAARRAWDYPACAVRLDAETAAIACGCPADDADALADWAARVALRASKDGVKRAILSGSERSRSELASALALIGVEVASGASAAEPRETPARRWLRLPWKK